MSADTKTKTPVKLKASNPTQVLDRLARMINRADDFVLGFVRCNHPSQQKELRRELLARLSDKHVLEVELDKPLVSLLDELTARWPSDNPPDVVCVYGLEKSINKLQEASPVLGRLNNDRDLLRRAVPVPLLIWLPDFALDFVARGAPDFWAWRSGVYEFTTESSLWQWECTSATTPNGLNIYSLSHQDKVTQLAQLKELLRTAQSLPSRGRREDGLVASLLNRIGMMYQSLGHWEKAATTHQESLDLFEVLGDQRGIAYTLHELGTLEHDRGNLQASERLCQQSLLINLELGDQGGVAGDLHQLAVLEQDRGNLIEAEGLYRESLETKQELHDKVGIAMTLHQLAMLEQGRSNLAEAEKLYRESMKINQELGSKSNIAISLHQMAMLEQDKGNLIEAEGLYRESMKINEEIGDRGGIAFAQGQLGRFYQQQEKWHATLEHSLNAWKMCCELHSPHSKLVSS